MSGSRGRKERVWPSRFWERGALIENIKQLWFSRALTWNDQVRHRTYEAEFVARMKLKGTDVGSVIEYFPVEEKAPVKPRRIKQSRRIKHPIHNGVLRDSDFIQTGV